MTNNMTTLDPKELLDKFRDDHKGLVAALEAALPKPTHPEHMFGRWAKHPEYGDVLIGDDVPIESCVVVIVRDSGRAAGSSRKYVALSSLTFPEQATRPEDVPVGEAWLVNVNDGNDSGERVMALKGGCDYWNTGEGVAGYTHWWADNEVTLISPLVPATPAPEPEPEPEPEPGPEHPRTLVTLEDYANAPEGTIVASPDNSPWVKTFEKGWVPSWSVIGRSNSDMAELLEGQDVLRKGWGNE